MVPLVGLSHLTTHYAAAYYLGDQLFSGAQSASGRRWWRAYGRTTSAQQQASRRRRLARKKENQKNMARYHQQRNASISKMDVGVVGALASL